MVIVTFAPDFSALSSFLEGVAALVCADNRPLADRKRFARSVLRLIKSGEGIEMDCVGTSPGQLQVSVKASPEMLALVEAFKAVRQ